MKEAKEIRDYRIQKKKAKERDDFLEAAKICNCLGELYAEHGDHQNAIIEHKEEIYLSEVSGDAIGVAVGHRKVGEAYCSLEMFEKAFFHQQKYLEIAKSNNSTLEQQRALATLGRTYFIQTDCTSSQEEIDRCLESSLKLFLQSLELCDHLYGSVSEKEMLEMRARLYLNLGNVYDKKENSVDSLKFVNKALIIAREQKLPEDIYRCHFSLAGLYFKNNNMDKALHNVKQALSTAKEIHSKPLESDALLLMAQVFLHVSEFERAIQILRQVHSSSPSNEEVVKVLKLAILGVQLTRKYNEETLERNLLVSICEKLGDFYAKFSPQQALKYYKEQLDLCLDSTNSILAPIYNSLALTYYECKQYKDALLYYQLELKMHSKTEYNEKFDTLCMILKILELTSEPFEKLKVFLDLAAECARESEKPNSAMMGVYKQFSDDILCCKTQEDYNFLKVKIEQSIDEIEEESEHSSDSGDGLSLNEEEKLFIEHECGNLEDEEDLTDKHTSRSTKRKSKPKINQANALGETPLHVAAIAGNTERVKILLQQGASIHARDASGWQPIHEACNHGHVDIVELLILNGADVNDPGGKHCGGTTPLHDACQNGHLDVVKLLLTHGASLNNRNNDGNTPLEVVRQLIKEDKEEFRENTDDKELYIMRQNVEQFLSNLYVPHEINIKDRNSIIFNQSANDGAQKYINKTSGNDDAILPYKRRKLKNHAPLELFITDSPDLEQIEEDNIPTTPSTASLDEDNCNLDSLDDLDIGLDSGEDFSEEISKNDSPVMSNLSYKIPNKVPNTQNTRDTIHTKSSKSKISVKTKRYRQSKIKVLPTSKEDFQFSSYNKKRNRCNKSMALRQQHLDSFIASPINDARSENLESETQLPESRNELLNYKQNVFRVKVHVNGTCFLIPCSNNGDANVSWLIEKVQSRYRTACGVFARLVLKTKDGALLNENDVIMNIIVNNEELVGEILELDFPSLKERFQLACQDKKITVNENLLEQLTADLNRLQLCNMFLTNDDINVLTTCLPCNENINALDISKTLLGDDDFKNFAVVLMTLPNLSFLDISNIGITSAGLCYFSDHLEEKVKKEYRTFIKKPILSSLNTLIMDFNDFSDKALFQRGLRDTIKICVALVTLSFRHCQLGFDAFYSGCPLENSHLQVLRASCIETPLTSVLQTINTMASLTSFEIALIKRPTLESSPFKPFSKHLHMLCLPKLSDLKVESLTAFEICEIAAIAPSLKSLSICNSNDVFSLVRYLSRMSCLYELDMSGCDNFDTKALSELVENIEANHSPIKKLTLIACSIKSPLLEKTWTSLNGVTLIYLNMNFNELAVLDKMRLRDWWTALHGNQTRCVTVDNNCLFECLF